jgi:hypothetical protein
MTEATSVMLLSDSGLLDGPLPMTTSLRSPDIQAGKEKPGAEPPHALRHMESAKICCGLHAHAPCDPVALSV